jgi:hypothetical protein
VIPSKRLKRLKGEVSTAKWRITKLRRQFGHLVREERVDTGGRYSTSEFYSDLLERREELATAQEELALA